MDNNFKKSFITVLVVSIIVSTSVGSVMGFWAGSLAISNNSFAAWFNRAVFGGAPQLASYSPSGNSVINVEENSAVIDVADKTRPAVVSIIVSKDLPIVERYYSLPNGGSDFFRQFFGDNFGGILDPNAQQNQQQNGTQKQEIGGGSGFLINSDGYILTNKHVVSDEQADYTVLMNDESKHEAKVIGRDPVNDLAILKIDGQNLPYLDLGDSSSVKIGQSVVAIGNALGEFNNTVSTGVISGLSRSVVAGGGGLGAEQLTGVIQTDASINPGNSGGPLLNLAGQVIGINTAIVQGAQNIGFAIPVNEARNVYDSVLQYGRIVRPWLGVRYIPVNQDLADQNQLSVNYGALIVRGDTTADLAVIPGSPADKAGLKENDIILEVDGQKLDENHPLSSIIGQHKPGDTVKLKILSQGQEKTVSIKLEEMQS